MFEYLLSTNDAARRIGGHSVNDVPLHQSKLDFSALVDLASLACDTAVSLISILGEETSWFKSLVEFEGVKGSAAEGSFCSYTIAQNQVFEVPDARLDPRFALLGFDAATATPVFYAGVPICGPAGTNLGAICVMDDKPRQLSEQQRQILRHLAVIAGQMLSDHHQAWLQILVLAEWQTLSNFSPFGLFFADPKGKTTRVNPKWMEIYGLTVEDSLGEGWARVLNPLDRAHVTQVWARAVASGSDFDIEFRILRDDGGEKIVRSSTRPVKSVDGTILGFVGSDEDVTVARLREKRLKFKQQRLQLIIAATQIALGEWNVQTGEMHVSPEWAKLIGMDPKDFQNPTFQTLIEDVHPEDGLKMKEALAHLLEGGDTTFEIELRKKHTLGHWVWLLTRVNLVSRTEDGKPEWISTIAIDITARKLAEERVQISERLPSKLGAAAGMGGWGLDLVTMKLTWTEEMRVLRGVSADYQPELSSALEIYDLESRAKVAVAIQTAKTLGTNFELELRTVLQGGNFRWVLATCGVEMENGKPVYLFGTMQDITERVELQKQLSASHLRMVSALESGGIGVWEMNLTTQELTWDRQMFSLFGHFEDPLATNPNLLAQEKLHPDDSVQIEAKLAVSAQEKSRFSAEYRVIWSDGSVHHLKSISDYVADETSDKDVLLGLTWDVTELRRLASELAEQSELLRVTLRSIGDAVITTDAQGVVTWLNPVAEKLTAWSVEDARGQSIEVIYNIVHEDTLKPVPNPIRTTLENSENTAFTAKAVLISSTGANYSIEESASLILDDTATIKGAILVFQDVTSQRQISREMAYRATHDTLTGTANRTVLQNHLDVLIARVQGGDGPHSLMYIDLDNFKRINDDCGHAAGDQVLQQVSAIFIDTTRSLDLLARVGGDEFAILLEHCSVEDAAKIAQKICDRMETYRYSFASKHYRIGASIGVVEVAPEWKLPEMIMQAADSACLVAKETGRNRVHIWRDLHAVLPQRQNEIGWLARLEQAFDGDLFRLMAQKISPLDPQTTGVCAEILLRIARPDGTYFQPEQFLPSAERFKMIDQIDRWVLSETVRVLQGQPDLADINTISLNISGISVADPSFHLHALAIFKAAGPAVCQRLALEITETSAVANLHHAADFIEKLHDLGVRVWLDDFGAGSASFGYLRALKVDCLKIDGQFVQGLLDDPLSQVTVGACVEVAKVLGISTVAEYVEDQAVLNKLKTFGVNFVQGFLIAKPMPFEVFLEGGGAPSFGGQV